MSATNVFQKISALTKRTTKILLAPGERLMHPSTGEPVTLPAGGPEDAIVFEIHAITPNESLTADAVITAAPPQMFEEHPNRNGPGLVKVMVGRDEEDPAYLAELNRQKPLRDAYITLMGCPEIREGAPGADIPAKAQAIMDSFPAFILALLAANIERISIYNRVGNEDVDSFFRAGSPASDTGTSKSSGGRSRRAKKN